MILGGVGLVAIIAVAVFLLSGDDKKTSTETTNSNEQVDAPKTNSADTKADEPKPEEATAPAAADKPAEAAKPEEAAKPDETAQSAPTPAAKPLTKPADNSDPNVKKESWQKQKNPPQTMGEVQTAIEMYGEPQWPESIDAAKKAEIMDMVSDLDVDGGIRSIRAKAKLVKAGYSGLFGIIDTLSKLDYRQPGDAAFGFELNKALEDITGGLNARYAAVQADEEMDPAKALWNTKTVGAWMKLAATWPDEAAFTAKKRARAKAKKN